MRTVLLQVAFASALLATLPCAAASTHSENTPQGCPPRGNTASGEIGCHTIVNEALPPLPPTPPYWHIDQYDTLDAASRAKTPTGTVIQAFGRVWLMTIAPQSWSAGGGARAMANIGPLPLGSAGRYTATYMEATFHPGMFSATHRHPGPEAWFMLEGSQCLETPDGRTILGPGESGIVRGDLPMELRAYGQSRRRSLVLILHDSTRPAVSLAHDWKPSGLCTK